MRCGMTMKSGTTLRVHSRPRCQRHGKLFENIGRSLHQWTIQIDSIDRSAMELTWNSLSWILGSIAAGMQIAMDLRRQCLVRRNCDGYWMGYRGPPRHGRSSQQVCRFRSQRAAAKQFLGMMAGLEDRTVRDSSESDR